jgi:hypothetical protein
MNNHFRLSIFILILFVLPSCAKQTSLPIENTAMIQPGDKIGNFLVTKGEQENITYNYDLDCEEAGDGKTYSCTSTVGNPVNVSTGIFDDTHTGKLDEIWSAFSYELYIQDRPVNLPAFGWIEVTHPLVGTIRYWNVVITANQPGQIITRDSGVAKDKPFESNMKYTFNTP